VGAGDARGEGSVKGRSWSNETNVKDRARRRELARAVPPVAFPEPLALTPVPASAALVDVGVAAARALRVELGIGVTEAEVFVDRALERETVTVQSRTSRAFEGLWGCAGEKELR
jgi:hypothetical protein